MRGGRGAHPRTRRVLPSPGQLVCGARSSGARGLQRHCLIIWTREKMEPPSVHDRCCLGAQNQYSVCRYLAPLPLACAGEQRGRRERGDDPCSCMLFLRLGALTPAAQPGIAAQLQRGLDRPERRAGTDSRERHGVADRAHNPLFSRGTTCYLVTDGQTTSLT